MIANVLHTLRDHGPRHLLFGVSSRIRTRLFSSNAKYIARVRGLSGLEIGGPSDVFRTGRLIPLYDSVGSLDNCNFGSETVWEGKLQAGRTFRFSTKKPPGIQRICEAADLAEIPDASYGFLLSSHMLEHSANPIKGLHAWRRVLRPGGSLILLLPDKRWTFDHRRPVTTMKHLIADFDANAGEDDLTHLPEILSLHDLARDPGAGTYEMFKARSERNFENRCLHHHVFDKALVQQILEYSGFTVKAIEEQFPHHIVAIAEKSRHEY
jgi:SAM-dependent methyltransferase